MSAVTPSERGEWWCPDHETQCFYCAALVPLDVPAVMWAGTSEIILHPDCAAKLGAHLIGDAREATLSSGVKHWTKRVAKALKAASERQEFAE